MDFQGVTALREAFGSSGDAGARFTGGKWKSRGVSTCFAAVELRSPRSGGPVVLMAQNQDEQKAQEARHEHLAPKLENGSKIIQNEIKQAS